MTFLHEHHFITDSIITGCACPMPVDTSCNSGNKEAVFQSRISRALLAHALSTSGIGLDIKDIAGGVSVKPYIINRPELHISLSHCKGLAACAFGSVELGIDVENIRPFNKNVMRRVCSHEEIDYILKSAEPDRSFFRCWTLKECYGKALGVGLGYPMGKAVFFLTELMFAAALRIMLFHCMRT